MDKSPPGPGRPRSNSEPLVKHPGHDALSKFDALGSLHRRGTQISTGTGEPVVLSPELWPKSPSGLRPSVFGLWNWTPGAGRAASKSFDAPATPATPSSDAASPLHGACPVHDEHHPFNHYAATKMWE
jgi:hypothetical protein